MVVTALKRAIQRRRPGKGLIFHSDRGVQYACTDFRKELVKHEFVQSMSRKGDCWDNAVAESFFAVMKTELVYHERVITSYSIHYTKLYDARLVRQIWADAMPNSGTPQDGRPWSQFEFDCLSRINPEVHISQFLRLTPVAARNHP